MRLEIESTVTAPPLSEGTETENVDSAEAKSALNLGIKAAQAGNRTAARTSLLKATQLDPRCESGWLWLASISEYPEELLGFLNHVLAINPENSRALEWKTATHALLSKTFVQRGIDACQENQKDFATECFQTALEHDEKNATAWLWMATLSDSTTVRVGLLEKALMFDPGNVSARAALESAKASILKQHLAEAKTAAVAGNNAEATRILDELLATNPDAVDAWTMKSHLADGFDEKILCFESILAIDPENVAARAGRDSLLAIFGTAEAAGIERDATVTSTNEPVEDVHFEQIEARFDVEDAEPAIDRSPTQDLELPDVISAQFSDEDDDYLIKTETYSEEQHDNHPKEIAAEPFASFAEETPEPAADAPEQLTSTDGTRFDNVGESVTSYADPQAATVAFNYGSVSDTDYGIYVAEPDDEESSPSGEFVIPMPEGELPSIAVSNSEDAGSYEAHIAQPESFDCRFCGCPNEAQSISCMNCMAVLTLSDLELLLANQNADKLILRQAVDDMERRRATDDFGPDELIVLGLGHLNLRNMHAGYSCLLEASKMSPNDVVLASQVNSLLIRLEEIREQEEAHLKMPKGKSILVVDDSATVRKLISGKLEKSGHDVICANDGVEAMERLENFVPDLILLDIEMPRMDGYQVCKNIRGRSATKDVPVVMISGKDGFFDKVRGRMAGTTGYITKPFGPETLMKTVEMYLSGEVPESEEV